MNTIILIGNGFDLAHGLKTSYRNFIDGFWESKKKKVYDGIHKHIMATNYATFRDNDEVIEVEVSGLSHGNRKILDFLDNSKGYSWVKHLCIRNTKPMTDCIVGFKKSSPFKFTGI